MINPLMYNWWASRNKITINDDFQGTTISTTTWTVANPNTPNPTISANNALLGVSNSAGSTSTFLANYIRTNVGISKYVSLAVDFISNSVTSVSGWNCNLFVDSSNRISIVPDSASPQKMRFFIIVGGVVVYSNTTAGINAYGNRFKIEVDETNRVRFYYWNTSWTEIDAATNKTYNIGSIKYGLLTFGNQNGVTYTSSVDKFTMTNYRYSTRYVTSNLPYPNSPGYMSDTNLMLAGLGNYQYSPLVYNDGDKTYISVSSNTSPNRYYIYIYDHITDKVSDGIYTGLDATGTNDIHHIGSIIKTANNKLLITQSSYHGPSADWKFSTVEGFSQSITFPAWTDSGVNEFTYHQLKVMANGDILDFGRVSSIISNYSYLRLYKSTNNGDFFNLVNTFLDYGTQGTPRYVPYPHVLYTSDDTIKMYINNLYYNSDGSFVGAKDTYYMESSDAGLTWTNISGSYSHNIASDGAINLVDLANFLVYSLSNNTDVIRIVNGNIIDGVPYLVGGSGNLNNSPLALYYWNGSAWVQKVITCSGHTILPGYDYDSAAYIDFNNNVGIFEYNNEIYLLCTELVSTYNQVSLFKTTDNGTTWSFVKQVTDGNYEHAQTQIIYNGSNYHLCVCEYYDGTNYRLFVKNIF